MTKVFWAFVLLAAAYGAATFLGPAEPRPFSAPIENACALGTVASDSAADSTSNDGPIPIARLRLRAEKEAQVSPTEGRLYTEPQVQLGTVPEPALDVHRHEGNRSPPKWVPPTDRVERTGHWSHEYSSFVDRAASQRPILQLPPDPPVDRTHIVVDGDNLPRLADRYLDDAGRDWEIFQLNRDVLRSHDLLPIGVILKLPPREPIKSANTPMAEMPPPHVRETLADASHDNLIPVRPFTASNRQVPQAQLLRPVQIDASSQSDSASGTNHDSSW